MIKYCPLLFLLLTTIGACEGILDTPIEGNSPAEIFSAMGQVYRELPPEDATAFGAGVTGLTSDIKGWENDEMSEIERDRYVFTAIRGMTPRQVIIIGSVIRAILHRIEYLEEKVSTQGSHSGSAHSKVHTDMVDDMARQYLARYIKPPNPER